MCVCVCVCVREGGAGVGGEEGGGGGLKVPVSNRNQFRAKTADVFLIQFQNWRYRLKGLFVSWDEKGSLELLFKKKKKKKKG